MDPWNMFCELCQRVVEEGNVCLQVTVYPNHIEMVLLPAYDDNDDEE